ncbi:uncharacterized protein MONBRDRAFT_9098 [Monosiga brevicollis MX1]|uniref:PARP catalytic domain-containing protein n=1 Tax=Monosiga brevicollis TaxID=81824 RepID=A9V228_MONBE|nr:uncharacterized protein MONBRDRAFT_9098 [Monosiga brevicollis MX1]EDQ88309.1 predicted protein [Monosiga brevicollis MX1]|eukprot:XP_001746902.1 hypothetical protein [Monosiga brevicollis MX1]
MKHDPQLRTAVANIQTIIDGAPLDLTDVDWTTFKKIITQATCALDQALQAPKALNSRLSQLGLTVDNLESVIKDLHGCANQFDLKPALLELQTVLATCPAPSAQPATVPEAPPTDLAAALDMVATLHGASWDRQKLLTNIDSNLKRLVWAHVRHRMPFPLAAFSTTPTCFRRQYLLLSWQRIRWWKGVAGTHGSKGVHATFHILLLRRDKIVRLGLDCRFAGESSCHRYGYGIYQADHPVKVSKNIDTLVRIDASPPPGTHPGMTDRRTFTQAPETKRYDSVIVNGPRAFREVIIFENAQIYPELVIYYTV